MPIIGTCSICGGAVVTPDAWYGVNPPTPTCSQCGAIANGHGPIIPMRRAPEVSVFIQFEKALKGSDK